MEPSERLSVVLLNRQRRRRVSPARLRRVLGGAAEALRVRGEMSLVLAGDRLLHRLNRDYRGKDRPTDVLSFPGGGGEAGLGDVIISVETAARNARALGRTLARELDWGIAVDINTGVVYVADIGQHYVHKFETSDGINYTPVPSWTSVSFGQPHDVTIDSAGNIYVADANNSRVVKLDPNGDYLAEWGGLL